MGVVSEISSLAAPNAISVQRITGLWEMWVRERFRCIPGMNCDPSLGRGTRPCCVECAKSLSNLPRQPGHSPRAETHRNSASGSRQTWQDKGRVSRIEEFKGPDNSSDKGAPVAPLSCQIALQYRMGRRKATDTIEATTKSSGLSSVAGRPWRLLLTGAVWG